MTDLTTWTPSEVDTALAAIYDEIYTAQTDLRREQRYLDDYVKHTDPTYRWYTKHDAERYAEKVDEQRAKVTSIGERILTLHRSTAPYNDEFKRRGGWTRAWLVDNTNGHVHRSMNCSTCFPTTQFGWLPQVSGLDEDEIVAQAGEKACTVCYPSAPAEVLNNPSALELPKRREERLAREAEKAEKQAAKAAKSLSLDGSVVTVRWEYESTDFRTKQVRTRGGSKDLKTYRAAELWVVQQMTSYRTQVDYDKAPAEVVDEVVDLMALKRGVTPDEIREDLEARAAKKRRTA